jgi:flagellar biosynthesis/type III secretory pathway protein FliH
VGFEIFREWLEEFGWDKKWVEQTQGETIEKIKAEILAEGKAEGLAKGKAEGLAEGKAEGLAKGKAEGLTEGKAKGLAEGKAKGLAEGKAKGLEASLHILQALKQNEPIESIAERYEQPVRQIILYRDILFGSNVTAV